MFFLGIDIGKNFHVASCIDSSINEVIFSNFKFKNDNLNSLNIVKSLLFTKLNFASEKNIDCFSLKKLTRFRNNLIKQRSKAKIQLIELYDKQIKVRQSGNFNTASCRMSKKGSSYSLYNSTTFGISPLQSLHQLTQKLIITTLPL